MVPEVGNAPTSSALQADANLSQLLRDKVAGHRGYAPLSEHRQCSILTIRRMTRKLDTVESRLAPFGGSKQWITTTVQEQLGFVPTSVIWSGMSVLRRLLKVGGLTCICKHLFRKLVEPVGTAPTRMVRLKGGCSSIVASTP